MIELILFKYLNIKIIARNEKILFQSVRNWFSNCILSCDNGILKFSIENN